MFNFNVGKWLGSSTPHGEQYIIKFLNFIINNKRLTNEIKRIIDEDKFNNLLKNLNNYSALYDQISIFKEEYYKSDRIQNKDIIVNRTFTLLSKVNVLNNSVYELFYLVCKVSDLQNQPIPNENILNPEKHKLHFDNYKKNQQNNFEI